MGAFMATHYFDNLLSADFRKSLNKVVFFIFTPSLVFASFAKSVTLEDMISWWFMPVNVGLTFLIGGILGWILVKLLKPNLKVEGLIIASCSSGNMGNLPIVIIPAICDEKGGPFGARDVCYNNALSYASFSMALGGIFIWTYTYQTMKNSSIRFKALEAAEIIKVPNKDLDANAETLLLKDKEDENTVEEVPPSSYIGDTENQIIVDHDQSNVSKKGKQSFWHRMVEVLSDFLSELMSPPAIATEPNNRKQCSIQSGPRHSPITWEWDNSLNHPFAWCVKPLTLISIIIARLFLLPAIGLLIVKGAANFGLLPVDPLFQYVLVMQYAMPPAMNISTMAQLFDVGTEECSVILLWTYSAAAIALTACFVLEYSGAASKRSQRHLSDLLHRLKLSLVFAFQKSRAYWARACTPVLTINVGDYYGSTLASYEAFSPSLGLLISEAVHKGDWKLVKITRVLASRTVTQAKKVRLHQTSAIKFTNNLGRYLAFNVFQGRATKEVFLPIVECVQSRLASWKQKLLNKPARLCLAQYVLASLPAYTMQVPLEGKFKQWHAFGELHKDDKLWVQLLRARYMHNSDVLSVSNIVGSFIWRSILKARNDLRSGFRLQLGNGDARFWLDPHSQHLRLVRWERPNDGVLALNTDGSVMLQKCGYDGLLRTSDGRWLQGFFGELCAKDISFGESYAIWKGLNICWNGNYCAVRCWTDSKLVVSLIAQDNVHFHHHSALIIAIKDLLSQDWDAPVLHVLREGNSCADFLAKLE
ncbi:Ribonuclease H-like superfamily [Sesbania bispinosa]|nr:Ribonuclease H-like superfamily [Sesbania bispinosa]